MRVLMAMNEEGWTIPGGHRRQLLKTADALRSLGADVRTERFSPAGVDWADIVHSFGLGRSDHRAARNAGRPVAASTIYWGANYTTRPLARSIAPLLRSGVGRTVREVRTRVRATRGVPVGPLFTETAYDLALALESADVLLPNARGEAAAIARELGVTTPAVVVPNAVDPSIFVASPVEFAERRGVICVGRIEPHKNQLGLIRALNGTALPLTIVGPPHPHHHDYLARCRREAGDAVTFIEETDEAGLPELLQRHRVHALPSLFETTGLASLEAALCGCSIVSTDRGWASEYLEDDAGYCSPWSQGSIREQIEHRYDRPPSNGFAERLGRSFNWTVTAERTLDAYELAMSSRGRANEN